MVEKGGIHGERIPPHSHDLSVAVDVDILSFPPFTAGRSSELDRTKPLLGAEVTDHDLIPHLILVWFRYGEHPGSHRQVWRGDLGGGVGAPSVPVQILTADRQDRSFHGHGDLKNGVAGGVPPSPDPLKTTPLALMKRLFRME